MFYSKAPFVCDAVREIKTYKLFTNVSSINSRESNPAYAGFRTIFAGIVSFKWNEMKKPFGKFHWSLENKCY